MAPKHSAEGPSHVPKDKKTDAPYGENTRVGHASCARPRVAELLAMSSMLTEQQYILSKVYLNRNTHDMWVCTDPLTKMIRDLPGPNLVFGLRAVVQRLLVQCWW